MIRRLEIGLTVMLLSVSAAADSAELPTSRSAAPDVHLTLSVAARTLAAGSGIRVERLDGLRLQGMLVGLEHDTLVLTVAGETRSMHLSEVRALWSRHRMTGRGLKIGALTGGITLGAYGALLGSLIAADDDGGAPLALGAAGLLGGALAGGAVGGLIGAALPRWRLVYGDESATAVAEDSRAEPSRATGGLAVGSGWSQALGGSDSGGLAWQALLLVRTDGWLQHGLEFQYARPGEAHQNSPGFYERPHRDRTDLYQFGWRGEAALRALRPGAVAPFLCGGLAVYGWQDTYLGYSLGGGLRVEPSPGGVGFMLEARRHDNLQHLTETDPSHWTATAAVTFSW